MLKLGVNVDHVATLREARGTTYPSVVEAALTCERAGAHGITVHLREDRRHIQDRDVYDLKNVLSLPLNLEMGNSPDIVERALDVVPYEVCIVPEKREEVTTEGGLDVVGQSVSLQKTVSRLRDKGIIVSMFIEPDLEQVKASLDVGANYVEFHTGTWCNLSEDEREDELVRLVKSSESAHDIGLKVNAGHGLNLGNVEGIFSVPWMNMLNIGHSIIADAVFMGLQSAVINMLAKTAQYGISDK